MSTFEMLLVMFKGSPLINVEDAVQFWSWDSATLISKIESGEVPIPYFRLADSQKAAKWILLRDLAEHIDCQHASASSRLNISWGQKDAAS